ncbi:unnamed protein product [Pleuronectes platessa]|uniref:Uncharacterized protein n=1 Tax=Pleuronectes platessa TaxID=8262 RepID=A0A9N7U4K1_PLEPL|nr:unnamed protein product [Pleuronectes platessa]
MEGREVRDREETGAGQTMEGREVRDREETGAGQMMEGREVREREETGAGQTMEGREAIGQLEQVSMVTSLLTSEGDAYSRHGESG